MDDTFGTGDIFQRRPDSGSRAIMWKIHRCKPGKELIGTCLSHDVFGAYTHWYRGRTVPCIRTDDCQPCSQGNDSRWHYWIGALLGKDSERVIVEATDATTGTWEAYFSSHRTLRGAVFGLSRRGNRDNSPLFLKLKPGKKPSHELPDCEPGLLRSMLLRMWDMPDVRQLSLLKDAAPSVRRAE